MNSPRVRSTADWDGPEQEAARRKRLGLRPNESDINRMLLASKVLTGDQLDRHERLLIARLLDPKFVVGFTKRKRGKGKPKSNATPLKADRIAEDYFAVRALCPHLKHKTGVCPNVAANFHVSASYVEKVVRKLDPARRAELEAAAASLAERFAKWKASPDGIAAAAALERARAKQCIASPKRTA